MKFALLVAVWRASDWYVHLMYRVRYWAWAEMLKHDVERTADVVYKRR